MRNIGMIESRKDLPLNSEMAKHPIGVHSPFDQLDGNSLLKLLIGSFRQINYTHSSAADFFDDLVGSDLLTNLKEIILFNDGLSRILENGSFNESIRLKMRFNQ